MEKIISVVIPTYNRAETLGRAIKSVLNQTYDHWECIIVDDGSTDNTKDVTASFKDPRIIYHKHKENTNASTARNTGLKMAKGDFLTILDSDDEWLPTKLEKQLKLFESLPEEYGMITCWMDYYQGDKLVYQSKKVGRGNLFPQILTEILTGGTPTFFFPEKVFKDIGGFDERISNGDDHDYLRRVAQKYLIDFVPEVLVKIYIDHGSETRLSDLTEKKNNLGYINSFKIALEKFKDDFDRRKHMKAFVYRKIAWHYAMIGDRKNFMLYNNKAWLTWPWRGRIKSTIRGLKQLSKN